MPKLKTTIINFIILAIFLSAIFICILKLVPNEKNNNLLVQNNESTEITPPQAIEVSWTEAQKILDSCEIIFVYQKRNLEVTMTTKDQTFYKTKQPKLNDVVYKVNHLPSVCTETIQKVTE